MPGMPFHLEKGPALEVLADYLNGDDKRALEALRELRAGTDLSAIGWLQSTTLNYPPYATFAARERHLRTDWFGQDENPTGNWRSQQPFDPKTNRTTGFWRNWYGDAQGILRETFIRALEVAMGLQHGDPIPATPARHWPLDIFWKCPQPWLEGWISWRQEPAGHGQVTVVLCTPGNGHPVYLSPVHPPARNLPEYAEEPSDPSGQFGMWVVTHRRTESTIIFTVEPTDSGDWILPTFGPLYHADPSGGIVTVAPCEPDGGVLASGRQFVP